jgi:hypothetical protein
MSREAQMKCNQIRDKFLQALPANCRASVIMSSPADANAKEHSSFFTFHLSPSKTSKLHFNKTRFTQPNQSMILALGPFQHFVSRWLRSLLMFSHWKLYVFHSHRFTPHSQIMLVGHRLPTQLNIAPDVRVAAIVEIALIATTTAIVVLTAGILATLAGRLHVLACLAGCHIAPNVIFVVVPDIWYQYQDLLRSGDNPAYFPNKPAVPSVQSPTSWLPAHGDPIPGDSNHYPQPYPFQNNGNDRSRDQYPSQYDRHQNI